MEWLLGSEWFLFFFNISLQFSLKIKMCICMMHSLMLSNYDAREDSWASLEIARRSKKSILMEMNTGYSLEELMLKLKLQYFGYPMERINSLQKTLILGKIEGRKRRGQQRMRGLGGFADSVDTSLNKLQ